MSRIFGIGVALCDAMATVVTMIHSSGALLIILLSLGMSVLVASLSSTFRSLYWPTYFWDLPEKRAEHTGVEPVFVSLRSRR